MIEAWLKCAVPDCERFGTFVFVRRNVAGEEVARRACGEHRARGEAWFQKGKPQATGGVDAAPPAQASLFG